MVEVEQRALVSSWVWEKAIIGADRLELITQRNRLYIEWDAVLSEKYCLWSDLEVKKENVRCSTADLGKD